MDFNGGQRVEGPNSCFNAASKGSTLAQPKNNGLNVVYITLALHFNLMPAVFGFKIHKSCAHLWRLSWYTNCAWIITFSHRVYSLCNNLKAKGKILSGFHWGIQSEANFQLGLQKYVIPSALYSKVTHHVWCQWWETRKPVPFDMRASNLSFDSPYFTFNIHANLSNSEKVFGLFISSNCFSHSSS